MRVVIFGGNGFIGKHLVELLKKQKKIEIKFLDKLKSPLLSELSNLKLIKKIGKIKFTSFEIGLLETLDWIKKSNKKNK